jgi:guanylate kinase
MFSDSDIPRGKAVVISAPSGAGKTTIVKHLLSNIPSLAFSVSATSRAPREYETHGRDYYFISAEEFRKRIENQEFLEWEEVYEGKYYGTLHAEIERLWANGKHVIFDVDVVGGLDIKEYLGARCLAIFVSPPDLESLASRLISRNTESEENLKERLEKASQEMAFAKRFDRILMNDELDKACTAAVTWVNEFLGA